MGVIADLVGLIFGNSRNVVRDTVEVFRENAEAGAGRTAEARQAAMQQFAAEFLRQQRSGFDRFMDGINRLPRPALALGTLLLFVSAMTDPLWFAARMQGIALVPEPLWWLLGVIVSFYFGARHQRKTQDFQRDLAAAVTLAPQVADNIQSLTALRADQPDAPSPGSDAERSDTDTADNPALADWHRARTGS